MKPLFLLFKVYRSFLILFFVLATQATFAEVLFYASYDQTAHPDKTTSGDVASQTSNLRFIPGIKGQALVVGSKEFVSYPVPGNLPATQGSISFFVKPIGWGDDDLYHFFISAQAQSNDWIVIYKVPEGKVLFVGGTTNNYSYAAAKARQWKDGEWKHICATWENGNAAIYVNGKLAGQGKWPVVSKSFGNEFLVGGTLWGNSSQEEAIDELTIYDKPLTKKEIADYFEEHKAALEKLNRPLKETSKHDGISKDGGYSFRVSFDTGINADFSGGSGKGKAVGPVQTVKGVEGEAILVGQDASVLYDIDGNLNAEKGTLSFWAKPVGWSGKDKENHYFVVLTGEDDWILLQTTVNNLAFLGGKRKAYSITTAPISDWPDGKWRHIMVTWDHGKNCVYFDGKLASCGAWPSVPTSLGDTIRIGGQLFGSSTGKTVIDDFRIYPTVFSEKEVKEQYLSNIKNLPTFLAEYEFMEKQEQVENDNLAITACNAIILPSSQSNSPNTVAENIMDGKFETRWLSAIGTFPNWIEVRWPQPVSLHKIVINETPMNKTAEYRIDAYVNSQWKPIVPTKTNLRKPGERIEEVFPEIETTKMRYYMLKPERDPQDSSSSITELQACGTADWCDLKETIKSPTWKSNWIWYPEGEVDDVVRYFRKHFQVADPTKINEASLQIAADDTYEVYLNGNYVGSGGIPTTLYDIKKWLKSGDNVIAVKCHEYSVFEGLIAELTLNDIHGHITQMVTNNSWISLNYDTPDWALVDANEKDWKACKEEGIPPNSPHASQKYFDVGPKERFIVKSFKVSPTEVVPDSTTEIKLELDVPVPVKDDYSFVLRVGDKDAALFSDYTVASKLFHPFVATSHWVPGEKQSLSVKIYIPDWAPHGKIPIFLTPVGHGIEGKIESNEGMIGSLNIRKFKTDPKPWPSTPPKTEVRYQEGHPMLFVNDKVLPPYIMTENTFFSYQSFGEHAKTGIHFWRVCVAKGVHFRYNSDDKQQEAKDFLAAVDQNIECLLKEDPDAYILVGTYFEESQAWTDKNPDDATLLADGRKIQHSFSSRKWINEVKSDVQVLVKHLMSQPYSGHVVGLHFGIGAGPETYYWGLNANTYDTMRENVIVGDFSPEHIRAFREWLKEKYNNHVQTLRKAWKDDNVDFQTASPDINVLRKEDLMAFKDPTLTRMPLDYWEFHSDVMAQRVIDIGKTVKEVSDEKYITGCWGFYSNGQNSVPGSPGRLQHAAFAGLQKVLESPYIDYLAGEQAYINVRWGTPVIGMNLMDSIRRHGKMVLTEYDVRTFFTPIQFTERTFSQQETLSVINRDTISAGIRGDACWWVGFPEGNKGRTSVPWFSEESIIETLKNGNKLYGAMYQQNLASVSEVAVFMNNADVYDLDLIMGYGLMASTQSNTLNNELTRLGTPFDLYHFDDVALDDMDQYKVYLFLNAFNLNQKQREDIKNLLSQKDKTVVWVYAPGFCDGTKLSIENIKDLTGFQVGYDLVKSLPEAIIDPQHAFTKGVEKGHKIKPVRYPYNRRSLEIGPIFYIDDPTAEILGRYIESNKPAYAYKKIGENHSLYMTIPYLDAMLLRSICKAAGVHLYADHDVYMDATRHFISITSTDQGYNGTIHLTNQNTVYNVLTGQSCGNDVDHFQAIVAPLTTALYYYGTDEEVKKFIESLHHSNSRK